ncbi:MAG: hypothetical protein GTN93_07580, partial [Anaerolineae bacterium]|nr:hypothetical protein [Anaerolineae bacterium]
MHWALDPSISPAVHCASAKRLEAARVLLRNGAEHDIFTTAAIGEADRLEEKLKADPAALQRTASRGATLLHWAAAWGNRDAVRLLVSRGISVEARDELGYTAVHAAAAGGQVPVLEMLSAMGANLDAKTRDGRTALHVAAGRGSTNTIEYLIASGVDPLAEDETGRTALHWAAGPRAGRVRTA